MFDDTTGASVFFVEDDPFLAKKQKLLLNRAGFSCDIFGSGEECLAAVDSDLVPDVVILDLIMPGIGGLEVLKRLHKYDPNLPVIVVSGQDKVATALETIKEGAYDYLIKPVGEESLISTTRHAVNQRRVSNELSRLRREVRRAYTFDRLIGRSEPMQKVFKLIERTLTNDIAVLILGDSGTGKELVARAIHYNGTRADKPLVVVNCAAIPRELVESELFGHEKGSFTGALDRKIGKFEQADSGTLFLDEIGELELSVQAKLLRALQEREIERVGGSKTIQVDVRLVCATQRDLDMEVQKERFREDLLYRINPYPILIPPLKSRGEDIELLCGHLLDKHRTSLGRKDLRGYSPATLIALTKYEWPGNVRQLENVVTRAMVLAERDVITLNDVPEEIREKAPAGAMEIEIESAQNDNYDVNVLDVAPLTHPATSTPENATKNKESGSWPTFSSPDDVPSMEEMKAWITRQAYEACNYNISLTAKKLGLGRATLYRQLEKFDIHQIKNSSEFAENKE
ncbi:transcriptional regulatory protein ZraR [bacterium BMS3Bbin04]|nr:transcriptional regulatory protein ZraR [bacterium BMS3Bbin04]